MMYGNYVAIGRHLLEKGHNVSTASDDHWCWLEG
jgi:hypothetical protein